MITFSSFIAKDVDKVVQEYADPEFLTKRLGFYGHWLGAGAEVMPVSCPVSIRHITNLLNGLTPTGTRSLVSDPCDPERLAGWKLVSTGWPSLSTLFAAAPEKRQNAIILAHNLASV